MFKQLISSINSRYSNMVLKILWIGLLVSGILLNPLFSYPGRDAGIFMYIGSLILKGKIPYLDVWENKGPLVFYINALGLLLGDGSRWGIWLMEFLFLFGAAWLCYLLIRAGMGNIPALIGVFVLVSAAGNVLQGGNYSEEYSILFSCLALWAFGKGAQQPKIKTFDLLIGLSLGLNILLRPNNISMQAAVAGGFIALAFLSRDWRLLARRLVLIALGAAAVLVPVVVYFAFKGALQEMINVVIVFNLQYSSDTGIAQILDGIKDASVAMGVIFSAVTLMGYVLSLFIVIKGLVRGTDFSALLLVLLLGLPIELILSTLSGRNYLHYFIGWAPYFGVLCAYVIFLLPGRFLPRLEKNSSLVLIVFILLSIFGKLETWKGYGAVLASAPAGQTEYVDPVASYLRENTTGQDQVFMWGFRPIVNFVSGRESPAYFLPYPLVHVDTPLTNAWAGQFYSQLSSEPPTLIVNLIEPADRERIPDLDPNVRKEQKIKWKDVVLAANLNATLDFIDENYVRVGNVNGADIYQLRTSLP
ncbi:MAG: glycosyltransferase family 39 protein [Anaerolineales bacterium]|nr:MAG: glycosyltransferase family 39 protein [Anaerolineales bacterium]